MKRATIFIYAKPPFIGLSKTRLAKSLGKPATARRIAYMSLARTLRSTRSSTSRTILLTTPRRALTTDLGGLWPSTLERQLQVPGDLTAKLSQGLEMAPPGPVLFIGADTPDISPAYLRVAIRSLQRHEAVFGPARDGGFWLFGLNKTARRRNPFHNVRWSSQHTLQDVRANFPNGAQVALLPKLIDLDEAQDWRDWRQTKSNAYI